MDSRSVTSTLVQRGEVVMLAVGVALLFALSAIAPSVQQPFSSTEVKFADASRQGLSIVPASCPSSPHYAGQCDGIVAGGGGGATLVCTPHNECAGNTVVNIGANCAATIVQTCAYPSSIGCADGVCLPPPPPSFSGFTATVPPNPGIPGGGPGGTFEATGHLQVRPTLVRSGDSAYLFWNVENAASCTVSGTNGDTWALTTSGGSGQQTGQILTRTTYTLSCASLPGATPASFTETVFVDIAPIFQEL